MRVAILGAYSLQDNRISGGPEAVVVQLADGLRRLPGLEVHIFTTSSRADQDNVQQRAGVTVHTLRLRHVPRWTLVRANAPEIRTRSRIRLLIGVEDERLVPAAREFAAIAKDLDIPLEYREVERAGHGYKEIADGLGDAYSAFWRD